MTKPEVSVVIPARDAESTLGRTLRAVLAQDFPDRFEVIVVDAGSEDGTAALARQFDVTLVEMGPAGPAAARNAGVAAGGGEVIAFTDADCFPESDWLTQGVKALNGSTLVQGRVRPDPGAALGPFDRTVWVGGEAGLYETANLLVRREAFEAVGGFQEWLRPSIGPPHIGEDLQFGWKIRRSGAATTYCDDAVVNHAVFPRGPVAYIAEYRRRRYFADIASEFPELRDSMFFKRLFLSRQTAAFDLALLSLAIAFARRSLLPLTGAAPYLLTLRGRGPRAAAVQPVADAVGAWSLLLGSLRRRTPVL